jgi:tungstate transport system substrate-binding protein
MKNEERRMKNGEGAVGLFPFFILRSSFFNLHFFLLLGVSVSLWLLLPGCSRPAQKSTLLLATTTSMQDSGLLDTLLPLFRTQSGIEVKVVSVGTGQALELGRRGDADVLLVHDPEAEERFVEEGFGVGRRQIMYNDFVLVGPASDPAGVKGEKSITAAFARVAQKPAPFVSRGDESGTHVKEKTIWRRAKIEPQGGWYIRAGTGMGQVLRMANEKRAYTLTDRGTFLAQRQALDLTILSEGDPLLKNQYSIILVNPEKHPHVHREAAQRFADFLLAAETQKVIANFGKERFGQPLFFTSAGGKEER